jgi:hypothetical protein
MKDGGFNSFISQLLNKNAEARLGGSFSNLKKHAVFDNISWVNVFLFSTISSAKRLNLVLMCPQIDL